MTVSQLIPWKRNRSLPVKRVAATGIAESRDPFLALHREMNRLFDEFWNDLVPSAPAWERYAEPNVDLVETDGAWRLTAELPGVDEKDIEVLMTDDTLTVRGEKRIEQDDAERRVSERFYGRFERRVALPPGIEADQVEASFRNGVLTVQLPKSRQAQESVRRIPLKAA